ncbi:hypothetical protein EPUS_09499 [Endocarpon pusillum Z07020]|uniref:Uncharacterized protein n=1 Tax=Endocarpon pusillum (strain Z07020 / HMAS-L-300199) TaxID=1263415 RepID=U1GGN1_ENDPU|nr:uncharacterized protein EPUS_09499 [Endocarpon pusillum Z07020]ERF76832.1 hypothetical protein EPUS_09499 [Endocarpon pusillum Z07020]
MSTQPDAHIHYGIWINWDHSAIVGSTITLSSRSGNLLTAFLAIFVGLTGTAAWKILAFSAHQLRSTQSPSDGLHHQQQVILRNTGAPIAAAWQFVQLTYFWRRLAKQSSWRSIPLPLLALTNVMGFAVASILSSEVTRAAGNEVLIRSGNCGNWTLESDTPNLVFNVYKKTLNDTITAATYARACYGIESNTPLCGRYKKQQISYTVNQNETCPFKSGLCLKSTPALSMDTGNISSHYHLGINTRKKDRIVFRRKTTCAPIASKGYITSFNYTDATKMVKELGGRFLGHSGDIIDFYNFGRTGENNFTYSYNRYVAALNFGYGLRSFLYPGAWRPVDAISRDDADVTIIFVSSNAINYLEPVYDPVFLATYPGDPIRSGSKNASTYYANYYVNPMACIDQHQICNPNNQRCTHLQDYYDAVKQSADLDMSAVQSMIVSRLSLSFLYQTIHYCINGRGAAALRATEAAAEAVSLPLPKDQWMIEVRSWFDTGLALLQQSVMQYAAGPPNVVGASYISRPADAIWQMMCDNQIVRSPGNTTNFSTLGVVIILSIGGILIVLSLSLDTMIGYIQQRWNYRDYQRVQWALNDKLQLQRLAYEGAGMGTWSGKTAIVPVTKSGERFRIPTDLVSRHFSPDGSPELSSIQDSSVTNVDISEQGQSLMSERSGDEETAEVFPGIMDDISTIISRHSECQRQPRIPEPGTALS